MNKYFKKQEITELLLDTVFEYVQQYKLILDIKVKVEIKKSLVGTYFFMCDVNLNGNSDYNEMVMFEFKKERNTVDGLYFIIDQINRTMDLVKERYNNYFGLLGEQIC